MAGYLGDYITNYSSPDMSKWEFYQDVHSEDTGKEDKKVHTAVLKKSPFMKKLSKENP